MQPSIIFLDEIDALAPICASEQDQVHSSVAGTLLALMDGFTGGKVVVIRASSRLEPVDLLSKDLDTLCENSTSACQTKRSELQLSLSAYEAKSIFITKGSIAEQCKFPSAMSSLDTRELAGDCIYCGGQTWYWICLKMISTGKKRDFHVTRGWTLKPLDNFLEELAVL